ncbi:methyltransferase [Mesorhizobium sp. M2D.F.Ca.ET.185.01.1.1]|uniref:class I SAM-dependent methyltransferase n=1 Tax=unclassified Mesorhizobium TaxID=325217 RepID=UPI000FCCD968|nr:MULTISPECIES: 50S ribosomal protein L11 methyltransferase [unclassified Mesorhizobium]TGP78268.1 methyltransferase [bacterium M00.F.Ca.ET.227.01.1.1]TGP88389.1 methyltransferase [bacterium M00.F.Ca.ET.221.01.1.1]TGP93603.1 methyltransferase [bacterium M00.F.Ca.ET.222.01.1.1]TGU13141.1 methyltransferase [bacterium M00.F.Ca.ET.163.01.1.1]TGU31601.1 methyltransferase [bacterium M00.F.Ca.ET.156.01.1.1]TGU45578.1 methyltransferase [bacterium M00.F.Ca.ET.146.01.1.1]TGV69299.1 methyltransferase 
MRLTPVPSVPEIRLYQAHPGSGLRRLLEPDDGDEGEAEPQPPYWAYAWAGGAVLARYILDRPSIVAGKRVLDLGAGSGLLAIAAMKAGAREVIAAEIDRNGVAALGLNAEANGIAIQICNEDVTAGPPPAVDLVLAGDVFYAQDVGQRMVSFLDRCLAAGIDVLVGDPGRAWLPRSRLCLLAEYHVPDVGGNGGGEPKPSAVFAFVPDNR